MRRKPVSKVAKLIAERDLLHKMLVAIAVRQRGSFMLTADDMKAAEGVMASFLIKEDGATGVKLEGIIPAAPRIVTLN